MGLLPSEDEGGDSGEAAAPRVNVSCSICLEPVIAGGGRSTALLLCGHEFHLDCIGSAFNAKGAMECPNCRKVDKGNWLYSNGCYSSSDLGVDESMSDDSPFSGSFTGMPYAVHWYPVHRSATTPSSFVGRHFPPAPLVAASHLLGHQATVSEHPAIPTPDLYPYIAVLHPSQPLMYRSGHAQNENYIAAPEYGHNSSHISRLTDLQISHSLGSNEIHYSSPESHPWSYSSLRVYYDDVNAVSVSGTSRAILDSGAHAVGLFVVHPFLHDQGCGPRFGTSSSFTVPPYTGAHNVHDYHQYHSSQYARGSVLMRMQQTPLPVEPAHAQRFLTAFGGHHVPEDNAGRRNFRPRASIAHVADASHSNSRMLFCHQSGSGRWSMPGQYASSSCLAVPVSQMHL